MENGLSTLQKYFRIQRVVVIVFFLMMAVSLLLPYTKVDVSSLYVPSVFSRYTIYGYELRLAVITAILAFICTIMIVFTKTRISATIGFFVAVLSGIMVLILPQEIHFNHIFIKPSGPDYNYAIGFYVILIGGICIIITAFINMILGAQNTQIERTFNPDLIDDLE
ncbi:MAG: hypothetical protein QE487_04755 [Fluviicola sp.]|nr:hypothetical protein [Fluviicola sp.]